MIINFSVSNFLSFKEKMTFSFISNNEDLQKNISFKNNSKKYFLNKSNVIYGANAS
jgi:AAA15 family ATPase/GTPase